MQIFNYKTVIPEKADCCPEKTHVRWLITKEMGAPNFVMRLFEMEPNGYSPLHAHAWEHEVFVLEGEGIVFDGKNIIPIASRRRSVRAPKRDASIQKQQRKATKVSLPNTHY